MRIFLRMLAVILVIGAGVWWVTAGRNTGWTKNKVAVEKTDEITEIVYTEYEDRFVPGVDFLAGAGVIALVLAALAFLGKGKAGSHKS